MISLSFKHYYMLTTKLPLHGCLVADMGSYDGETASYFTKNFKVSRKKEKYSFLYIKDWKRWLKFTIKWFYVLKCYSVYFFSLVSFWWLTKNCLSSNKMSSKSNTFIRISIFFFSKSTLYMLFFTNLVCMSRCPCVRPSVCPSVRL